MKFLLLFKPVEPPPPGQHPCRKDLPEMVSLMTELAASGVLISTQGLLPSDHGARVRLDKGKLTVRDGPFAEAKELIAGVALIEVKTKQDAVDLAKRFLTIAGGGESDVLEVME